MDKFSKTIKAMFDSIYWRYDFMNHLLSCGFDIYWRAAFIDDVFRSLFLIFKNSGRRPYCSKNACINVADIASGTGDVIIRFINMLRNSKPGRLLMKDYNFNIYCYDFSYKMLKKAKEKIENGVLADKPDKIKVYYVVCDACNSCFKDSSFDTAFLAFGLRNFFRPRHFIAIELKRVLKKNRSIAAILEFNNIFNLRIFSFFQFYYNYLIKIIAFFWGANASAYKYLVESIKNMASDDEYIKIIKKSGFKTIKYARIFPYIVSRYIAIINNG